MSSNFVVCNFVLSGSFRIEKGVMACNKETCTTHLLIHDRDHKNEDARTDVEMYNNL